MKKVEQKVLKFIDEKKLIADNDKVLIGLSGGPDSVFLISFLKKYSKKLKISLGAIHINHLLRGKEADKDEQFCNELAEKLSVRLYTFKKNIKAIALKEKISLEEAGRKVRYNQFEKILKKEKYTKIATAHNADENTETVLLNLIKGTGLSGISGIPPQRDKIIRPLLPLTKNEILDYLNHHKLKYKTDQTNFNSDAERNFLRNQVIPLIEKRLNPSLSNTIFKSSEVFREMSNAVKNRVEELTKDLVTKAQDSISISLKELKKAEPELYTEIFRSVIAKEYKIQISFNDCKKIISLLNMQTGKSIQIFDRIRIVKERDELIVYQEETEPVDEFMPVIISADNSVKLNSKKLSITEVGTINRKFRTNKNVEFISADNTSKNFLIRKWMPGDRFIPFGMNGSKKISDFLNEQKLSSFKKKEQKLLLNGNRIVWVIGLRIDNHFRVTSETKKVFKLCLL
jgi:tRNA(Ile)-lysidine synthase